MLLRRRYDILRFNFTELLLSVMTELLNLLIGKKRLKYRFFHAPLPIFISSFNEIWEGLISIAAPVECGMGRAVAPAAPPLPAPGSASAWQVHAVVRGRWTPTYYDLSVQRATWLIRRAAHYGGSGMLTPEGGTMTSKGGSGSTSEGGSMTVEGGTATSEGRNQNSAGRHYDFKRWQ